MDAITDYERLGGDEGLSRLVRAFVDRVFEDFIIGFLFAGKDRARFVQHETAFAAAHLGGPRAYAGRPLGAVHGPLKINRGHFRRRHAILRHVLREHGVDDAVIARWIGAEQGLERVVTTGIDCVDGG